MNISELSIRRPVMASVLTIIILLFGFIGYSYLGVREYPSVDNPIISVTCSYPGANADVIENQITEPLEQNINGIPGIRSMSSVSSQGQSRITVEFELSVDLETAANDVRDKVSRAQRYLPRDCDPPTVTKADADATPILMVTIQSDKRSLLELSEIADLTVKEQLQTINNVSGVQIWGEKRYSMRLWLDPAKMAGYGITPVDIKNALDRENVELPSGSIEGNTTELTIRTMGLMHTTQEFNDLVVREASNRIIRLSDVGRAELGPQDTRSYMKMNGIPMVGVVVIPQPGANHIDIADAVYQRMETMKKDLPDDVVTSYGFDNTRFIRASIDEVRQTVYEAFILVIIIIFLFLRNWRVTLIPCIVIPVSLIGTFIFFPLLGFSINIISLLGLVLAIGLVVDDAIVVVEAAQVNIERGMKSREAAIEAMRNVASPIVATTVVLLAVFIPMSFVGGISGRLFQQFAVTISVSVVLSAFNALTLSPALCALLLKPRKEAAKGFFAAFNRRFDRWLEGYSSRIAATVRHMARTAVLLLAIGCVIGAAWYFMPGGFLPEEDQGYVMVVVNAPEASSLRVTQEALVGADRIIRSLPEVQYTSYAAGFNMLAGIAETDSGVVFVKLVDYSDRKRSAMQIAAALNGMLYEGLPEAEGFAFIPPSIPGLGVTSGLSAVTQDLEGRGTAYLGEQTVRYLDSLRRRPEIATATTSFNAGVPQRRLVIDKAYAMQEGVELSDVYSAITTYLGGAYINNFNRFGKLYQTYLSAAPDYRTDRTSLDSYFVKNARNESVPVSAFVSVRDTVGPAYISQFNLYRSIALNIAPADGVSSKQAMEAVMEVAGEVLPADVDVAWSGTSLVESNESKSSSLVYLLSLAIVFLALAALYESWGLPAAILLGVPPAVLGAFVLLWFAHLFDSLFINDIYMQISLVMLIGLAAKNAILVVEYADRLFFEQKQSLVDAAVGAAKLRVRPILMTAFAFILGVMPLIFADGVYSTARNIMGVALVGGMLLATLLGIFIYPSLYYLIARLGRFERKRDLKSQNL